MRTLKTFIFLYGLYHLATALYQNPTVRDLVNNISQKLNPESYDYEEDIGI